MTVSVRAPLVGLALGARGGGGVLGVEHWPKSKPDKVLQFPTRPTSPRLVLLCKFTTETSGNLVLFAPSYNCRGVIIAYASKRQIHGKKIWREEQ